jgi:hypothetical protein
MPVFPPGLLAQILFAGRFSALAALPRWFLPSAQADRHEAAARIASGGGRSWPWGLIPLALTAAPASPSLVRNLSPRGVALRWLGAAKLAARKESQIEAIASPIMCL